MAEKQIAFSPQDQMEIEAIVIDKDKDEAVKYLAKLLERLKGHPGHVCGTGPIK